MVGLCLQKRRVGDRKSTRLNSSHLVISYAVFCLKKKKQKIKYREHKDQQDTQPTRTTHRQSQISPCDRVDESSPCLDYFLFMLLFFFFFLIIRPPPKSPFFPSPTLFR